MLDDLAVNFLSKQTLLYCLYHHQKRLIFSFTILVKINVWAKEKWRWWFANLDLLFNFLAYFFGFP